MQEQPAKTTGELIEMLKELPSDMRLLSHVDVRTALLNGSEQVCVVDTDCDEEW